MKLTKFTEIIVFIENIRIISFEYTLPSTPIQVNPKNPVMVCDCCLIGNYTDVELNLLSFLPINALFSFQR